MKPALILVDIQNDFLPGGALAVPDGDQVISIANLLLSRFDLTIATQDWHPANHGSFASSHDRQPGEQIILDGLPQILWPVHCVQNTPGADFPSTLRKDLIQTVFRKGQDPAVDSYSGFFDNGRRRSTGLADFLQRSSITDVYIGGLATDYCVKATALDAVREGFKVLLILDACRGVNLNPGDVDHAISDMQKAGVELTESSICQ